MEKIKSYQEIPVDLFSWGIEKYNGIVHGKEYNSTRYGIIKPFNNNSIFIRGEDLGFCHPSFPYTALLIYDLSVGGVIKKDFGNLYELNLDDKVAMQISSVRVSKKYNNINTIYDLLFKFPNKKKKEMPKNLEIICNIFQKKTKEMLNSKEYRLTDRYDCETFKTIFGDEFESCWIAKREYEFMKFVEKNRVKDIDFEEWVEQRKVQKINP